MLHRVVSGNALVEITLLPLLVRLYRLLLDWKHLLLLLLLLLYVWEAASSHIHSARHELSESRLHVGCISENFGSFWKRVKLVIVVGAGFSLFDRLSASRDASGRDGYCAARGSFPNDFIWFQVLVCKCGRSYGHVLVQLFVMCACSPRIHRFTALLVLLPAQFSGYLFWNVYVQLTIPIKLLVGVLRHCFYSKFEMCTLFVNI